MKPRYNLRIQSIKPQSTIENKKSPSILSSRVSKKAKPSRSNSVIIQETRRHSLRLTPTIQETVTKRRQEENDNQDEKISLNRDDDDDYDDLLARHHRRMLEEQKDRKLYERYVRGQRTLRRLQCRRTHTAHLNEATRNRLLRELQRERRYAIEDKICAHLANHRIIFQHGCNIESKQAMTWSTLEEELPYNRNVGSIHQLDVMIDNLKKVMQNSKSSISKPRLSVRERQNQRLAAQAVTTAVTPTPTISNKLDTLPSNEIRTPIIVSNSTFSLSPAQLPLLSLLPRVPVVRFTEDQFKKIPTSNSQHLTCIQNVLPRQNNEQSNHHHHNRNSTSEISTPNSSRKSLLRQKSSYTNSPESPPAKRRPIEKENYSMMTNSTTTNNNSSQTNIVLRNSSTMVPIKYPTSSSSSRSHPNTRKHSIIHNSLITRRQARLSTNV